MSQKEIEVILARQMAEELSPPLFPVFLRDMESILFLHEVPCDEFEVGELHVTSAGPERFSLAKKLPSRR